MKRRDFVTRSSLLASAGLAGIPSLEAAEGTGKQGPSPESHLPEAGSQQFHPDFITNVTGVEYAIIGNGRIIAAMQSSRDNAVATHGGLLLMSSGHFTRKASTLLFHPERGLMHTRCHLVFKGTTYTAQPESSQLSLEIEEGIPSIKLRWKAGAIGVHERFTCHADDPLLLRTITLETTALKSGPVVMSVLLYPNLMLFDEYRVDPERKILHANGYLGLDMEAPGATRAGDRHLFFEIPLLLSGSRQRFEVLYSVRDTDAPRPVATGMEVMPSASAFWRDTTHLEVSDPALQHLYDASKTGIRAAVARDGKMDGGIWQYNLEWVRDMSMVSLAASMCGLHDASGAILRRILTRFVDDRGRTIEASRSRPDELMELDQNGALLHALHTHALWTGDHTIVREHWQTIRRVAEYVLTPDIILDRRTGLLKSKREYWERDTSFGVEEGYENAYQLWNILGLQAAAEMARFAGTQQDAARYAGASKDLREAFLRHPTHSLVADGRLVKRRLLNGDVQSELRPQDRSRFPAGMPLREEAHAYCDPDASSALPIVYGVVEPHSTLAANTLASMEILWNQGWTGGGYGRYHRNSEPDSPGAWPFPTMFLARAYLEAGNSEKVWRILRWMHETPGGRLGAWFEFTGERPTPPLPPVGVVVWTWAEIVMFCVHHLLGFHPTSSGAVIRPRALTGIAEFRARVNCRGHHIDLTIRHGSDRQRATRNGNPIQLREGAVEIDRLNDDEDIRLFL